MVGQTTSTPDQIADQLDQWNRPVLRWICGVLSLAALVLLAIASTLEPNTSGLGTHHQLGLPPCSMRVIFGIRCPSCGMTTSWAHLMNGNLVASARANVGGLMLAFYAVGSIVIGSRVAWNGRMPSPSTVKSFTIALVGIALVTVADWLIRLWA